MFASRRAALPSTDAWTWQAYVRALEQCQGDKRTPIFILEQLCALITPK